jgi:hypothetical protein
VERGFQECGKKEWRKAQSADASCPIFLLCPAREYIPHFSQILNDAPKAHPDEAAERRKNVARGLSEPYWG